MKIIPSGLFICVEGPDACGKSTIAPAIARALTDAAILAVLTREPWGSPAGKEMRSAKSLTQEEAQRLAWADRNAHMQKFVMPALSRGAFVVTERFWPSTVAYNMSGDVSIPLKVHAYRWPDLTIAISCDENAVVERARARALRETGNTATDAFDGEESIRRACQRYEAFWEIWPADKALVVVDGDKPLSKVIAAAVSHALACALPVAQEVR